MSTRLAKVLLESLHDSSLGELEAEWQRVAAYDGGETQVYRAKEVFATAWRLDK